MSDKILLVEDDENLGDSLSLYLKGEGYDVTLSKSILSAKANLQNDYNLIILDWMLPDGQGVDLLKHIRESKNLVPVVMLTAKTELIDKVIGLESGANDYMTKPFEPRELVARIRVQLRDKELKDQISTNDEVLLGDLKIDILQREVIYKSEKVDFTKMEFDFLRLLAESPNRAYSREEILNKVWGYENYPSTRTVDTHVLQIRNKLTENLIETVRGIGYRLRFNK